MKKQLRTIAFMVGSGLATLCLSPMAMHAQQVNQDQRAYDTGYQNGVNDARRNRPMNMNTDDWHGDRLNDYQRGYREGYKSAGGYGARADDDRYGNNRYGNDAESQRAYQTGYQNGIRDRERNRAMNASTDDWHGERLQAYRQGYEEGYRSARQNGEHGRDRDDDR